MTRHRPDPRERAGGVGTARVEIRPPRPSRRAERSEWARHCLLGMVDKVTAVAKAKLGKHIGRLADLDMVSVNRAWRIFLGLAG